MSVWNIARKDLIILSRDRSALIFIFGLPLVFVLTFGTIFAGQGGRGSGSSPIKILVANQDTGPQGAALLTAMTQVGLAVDKEPTNQESQVIKRVKSGDRAVGVVIPPDFTAQLEQAVQAGPEQPTPAQAHLRVLIDPAQAQLGGMAQGALFAATQRVSGPLYRAAALARVPEQYRALASQSLSVGSGRAPVALDVANAGQKAKQDGPSAGDLIIPGFLVYFVFFMANGVAVTLINERQEGTLRRMLSAPIARGEILTGKLLARGLVGILQTVLLLLVGVFWLHVHVGSSPTGLALTALVTIFAATGLGLLIATMGKTVEQIQGMTTLALLLMGLLSGCLVPRQFLPETMQKLSLVTPHAWALNAYQDLMLRHQPLFSTLPNIGVVVLFGLGFFGIALARFRYE